MVEVILLLRLSETWGQAVKYQFSEAKITRKAKPRTAFGAIGAVVRE